MTKAWKRGAAAVVTDGGLRDGSVLAKLPFPTYVSQVTITTRAAQHHVADLNVPIGCAGVAVYPGDVLIGDRDGVVKEHHDAVARELVERPLKLTDKRQSALPWLKESVGPSSENSASPWLERSAASSEKPA